MTLRAAIAWSTIVHLGFMTSRPPQGLTPPRSSLQTLEVSYLPAATQTATAVHAAEPARVPQTSVVRSKPSVAPSTESSRAAAPAMPAPRPLPKIAEVSSIRSDARGISAAPWDESEFSVVQHKEQVRLHLKHQLRYPSFPSEGMVRLRLSLTPEGFLKEAAALESSDPRLGPIALADARSAVPYPRFSEAMRGKREAAYEFLVRYEPRENP